MKPVRTVWLAAVLAVAVVSGAAEPPAPPVPIGTRLELFVDDTLIHGLSGGAQLQLHRPAPREVALRTDAPWEGNAVAYQSVFHDGKVYRLYYRGMQYRNGGPDTAAMPAHPVFLCYAESDDGIHWRKPELGLFEFNGSKANNIVLTPQSLAAIGGDPAHTATLLDANPACPPDARYKIVIVGRGGLYVLKSGDGVRFTPLSDKPVITKGAFDSQNLLFWDPVRAEYREYHRGFKDGMRDIMTAATKDLTHFPEPKWLQYPGAPKEQLYSNQIQPYYRAPHLFLGFPLRYTDQGWSDPVLDLPGQEARLARARAGSRRYGTAVTDTVLMASRDGVTFRRWGEAFIRPGPRTRGTWVYGDNFAAWGLVETAAALADAPRELSFYVTEDYWQGTAAAFRRHTLRVDGFVSACAPLSGGELVTKPIAFEGGNLALNLATSGAGGIQVEVQDAAGQPLRGWTLADCPAIRGDTLRHVVRWTKKGGDVRELAGKPIRLRFALKDADLYAYQFVAYEPDPVRPDLNPPPPPPAAK